MVERDDGTRAYLLVEEIEPGMTVLLAAGERVPVDSSVMSGISNIDCSLVTGESRPRTVVAGDLLQAGTLNLTAPLTIEATATTTGSFLAEMVRLVDAAESGRSRYRRIADRAARLYAPLVHSAAFASLVIWAVLTGDWHRALTIAIAVLIITCPCALGLAVPMVQVVAARRLFERGIMVKDGAALERLAEVDTVVFDKTGTLTVGTPRLRDGQNGEPANLELAACLAAHSRHPYSRALVAACDGRWASQLTQAQFSEIPGYGVEARSGADTIRLGRTEWAAPDAAAIASTTAKPCTALARNGRLLGLFTFDDPIRPGARTAVTELRRLGIGVEILSGDGSESVDEIARSLGIVPYRSGALPADKAGYLAALSADGHKVLMVGDGLNDAPALAAAHVSMAPSTGADIGRNAADFVFLRDGLDAVPFATIVSRRAARLVRQNLALAVLYNAAALPFAMLGFVTPLIAALAMSISSILVVANALRFKRSVDHQSLPLAGCRSDHQSRDRLKSVTMSILAYLIPISLGLGAVGLAAFLWSLQTGQYEDLSGAAERILFDENDRPHP